MSSSLSSPAATSPAPPRLRRSLTLWDLVFYGIILIQPTAPMPLFGVVSMEARGHVVTTILIAMAAMLLTAISYGRMARAYPSAGSAFTYVGREIHPALGYLTGWSMAMDYMLNPILCTVWCSKAALNILPEVPYPFWVCFFATLFTSLNLRGVRSSARTNQWLAIIMGVVVGWFFVAAARFLWGPASSGPIDYWKPFYDSSTFSFPLVLTGTSIAALTYIGFDGISTLSEEVENPKRNILLATVLTCVITGILASLEVYAGQLIWGNYHSFPDVDTAFVHVAGRAGGPLLFQVLNLTLLVASIGSGAGSQLGAARLLYGMGRENAIPRGFFGVIDPKRHIPRNNVLFVGGLALLGGFVLSYQLSAELLNFGAFIAFIGVNLASFTRYWLRAEKKTFLNALMPLLGALICFYIWLNLRGPAKLAGGAWVAVGLVYGAIKTGGFRRNLLTFKIPEEESP
jgi:amino acid transporter